MLARLWWKEWRSSWPIGLIVALAALGLELLLLDSAQSDAGSGVLTPIALGWATLYAFALGAAAFAGERETRTLALLDALPVGRTTLWLGKATFTLVSSLVLALVLVAAAEAGMGLGQPHRDWAYYGPRALVLGYGTLVFEAVGWSLLWSALLSNALVAAILSILSVAAVRSVLTSVWLMDEWFHHAPEQLSSHALGRLALAAAAAAASYALVTLRPGILLVIRGKRRNERRMRRRSTRRDEGVREVATGGRPSAFRSLVWQTYRDGRTVWALWMMLGLAVPVLLAILGFSRDLGGTAVVAGVVLALVAGVSLFGHDSQQRTSRFFAGHGVDTRLVWLARVSVGLLVLAVYGLGLRVLLELDPRVAVWSRASIGAMFIIAAFAVGQLSGMLVRRQITAVVTGLLALVLLFGPHMMLAQAEMVPSWSVLLTPLALLAIGLGWSGPWVYEESGARKWRSLAVLAVVPAALLMSGYVAYRAWSVPDVGYPFDRSALRTASLPADTTAIELYRQVARRQPGSLRGNLPALSTIRDAARQPHLNFGPIDRMNLFTPDDALVRRLPNLAHLLAVDARERESRGDLAGSWDDQGAVFAMSAQLTEPPATLARMQAAFRIRGRAFGPAFSWASLPGQSPALLRRALDDIRRTERPAPRETIELEHEFAERTLNLPGDELRGGLLQDSTELHLAQTLFACFITAPWERARARRVLRAITARHLANVSMLEASRREALRVGWIEGDPNAPIPFPRPAEWSTDALAHDRRSTPLVRSLEPPTEALLARYQLDLAWTRGLELFLALRIWQLEHGGEYPATLQELVPSVLPILPVDPYSDQPFRYATSQGQDLLPLDWAGDLSEGAGALPPTRPGQRLVYSVGPDGRDDEARASASVAHSMNGDLVIPLPDPKP